METMEIELTEDQLKKDASIDTKIKEDLLKRQYEEKQTYDKTLQTTKHRIKWSNYSNF